MNTKATHEQEKPRLIMTVLAVRDLKRSTRFYKAAFGWSVGLEVPVLVKFELPDGHDFMLYQREAFGSNTGQIPELLPEGTISGTELYFHVDDLKGTIARLKAAGARELSGAAPRPWGDEAAYYADPDGNVLAVARPLPDGVEL